jgi:hypothetical protein
VIGQLHAPASYSSGKEPRCPIGRRLHGSQRWSGLGGEEKLSAPAGNRSPVVQPVAQTLHWSSYPVPQKHWHWCKTEDLILLRSVKILQRNHKLHTTVSSGKMEVPGRTGARHKSEPLNQKFSDGKGNIKNGHLALSCTQSTEVPGIVKETPSGARVTPPCRGWFSECLGVVFTSHLHNFILENLTVSQLVKKFPTFDGTQWFVPRKREHLHRAGSVYISLWTLLECFFFLGMCTGSYLNCNKMATANELSCNNAVELRPLVLYYYYCYLAFEVENKHVDSDTWTCIEPVTV